MEVHLENPAGGGHLGHGYPAGATSIERQYQRQRWRRMLLGQAVAYASALPFSASIVAEIYNGFVYVYEDLSLQYQRKKV